MKWVLDLPERERMEYSTLPCSICGWHHRLLDFRHGHWVRTLVAAEGHRTSIPPGTPGVVRGWSQYGADVSVRVQFDDIRDEYGFAVRANYNPCQLEHA